MEPHCSSAAAWAAADVLHTNFYHLCLSQQTKTLLTVLLNQKVTQIGNLSPAGLTGYLTSGQPLRRTLRNAPPQTALCRCTCRCWPAKLRVVSFFNICWRKKINNFLQPPPLRLEGLCVRRRLGNNNTMILFCTLPLQTQRGLCVYSGKACNKVRLWSHRVLAD